MEKDKELTEEITFVAKRYRENKFNVQSAWKKMNLATQVSGWRRYRVAAVIAGAVVLSAVAGTAIYYNYNSSLSSESEKTEQTVEVVVNPTEVVKALDFEYAPLPKVIEEIKNVYGVEVENVPEDAQSYNLSMHFEGNPVELVDAINEILGTEMSVKATEQ